LAVVDCCHDINDAVVAADPNYASSQEVKTRSKSSRLGYRVASSSADDLLLDDHDADDLIPTEPPDGLGYRLSPSDNLFEHSIPSEPPDGLLLGTRLSFSTDGQVQPRRESSRLDSRLLSPSEPIVD
jgi:hypothetical protein